MPAGFERAGDERLPGRLARRPPDVIKRADGADGATQGGVAHHFVRPAEELQPALAVHVD